MSAREVIAVAGKGGAGKTTVASIIAWLLAERGKRLLAVDADPPVSLCYSLGAEPEKTVGQIRHRLIEDPDERRRIGDRHIRDVIIEEALLEVNGIDLLVVGQAEGPGCYCGLNELLKYGIESMAQNYDVTVIDCEAGIEQINRRVIGAITTLVMVSDATLKGLRTAGYLQEIARKYGVQADYRTGLVINRAGSDIDPLRRHAEVMGLELWGVVPVDPGVAQFDLEGRPTIDLPVDSPSVKALGVLLSRLGLMG